MKSVNNCHDGEKVNKVLNKRLAQDELTRLSSVFKALADNGRSHILYLLTLDEFCVHDLAELIGLSQSATSHNLKILRRLRLVKTRKEGKLVYYQICDDHVTMLLNQGLEHAKEQVV